MGKQFDFYLSFEFFKRKNIICFFIVSFLASYVNLFMPKIQNNKRRYRKLKSHKERLKTDGGNPTIMPELTAILQSF